jgi:hypothetical protein
MRRRRWWERRTAASLQCLQPERDAKAELNRRNQACEVLTDTGIRVARKKSLILFLPAIATGIGQHIPRAYAAINTSFN